jgi:hypothetical protein
MQGSEDETTGIGFVSFKNQAVAGVSRNTLGQRRNGLLTKIDAGSVLYM